MVNARSTQPKSWYGESLLFSHWLVVTEILQIPFFKPFFLELIL
jgi:hypothetical protein